MEDANAIIDKLTEFATGMSQVVDAVAEGDLSQRVELRDGNRPLRGELLRLAKSVNGMVELLDLFTGEVTRVAREVGTEGRLGGRAPVRGMSGTVAGRDRGGQHDGGAADRPRSATSRW